MRLRFMIAAVALISGSLAAHADTLTFGSFTGSSSPGLSNGAITYTNTMGSGSVVAAPNNAYAAPFTGTQYVSYTASLTPAFNYTTTYTTSYTGNLTGYSGSLSLLVDNSASVYLNGFLIGSGVGFTTPTTFTIPASDFVNGMNTFTFNVLNDSTQGPTAFDFIATATTPEPSSIALLGTGLLGVAGVLRKRLA